MSYEFGPRSMTRKLIDHEASGEYQTATIAYYIGRYA